MRSTTRAAQTDRSVPPSQPRNYLPGQIKIRDRSCDIEQLKAQPGHDMPEDGIDQSELNHDTQYGAADKLKGQDSGDPGPIEGGHRSVGGHAP